MVEMPTSKMLFGVVENTDDPEGMGRVQVRVYGYHTESKAILPTEMLRWYFPMLNNSAGVSGIGDSPTGYVKGSTVMGFFLDGELQNAIIMGSLPGKPEQYANMAMGFNDPEGVYPRHVNEPDVNRLARGDDSHWLNGIKEQARIKGIQGPMKMGQWSEPPYQNNAKYPHNHVTETHNGHVFEVDDTPGNERIHQYHRSGTYQEVDAGGDRVVKIVGDGYEIIAGDKYANVRGTCNLTVDGDVNWYVKGNWNVQIDGDKREVIQGGVKEYYLSGQDTEIQGSQTTNAGSINSNSDNFTANSGKINLNEG